MIKLMIVLVNVAAIANAFMDIIAHKYEQSIFYSYSKEDHWMGRFLKMWIGPDSWKNKHSISKNVIITFLFKTVLVWLTDGWHFGQFIFFSCYQILVANSLAEVIMFDYPFLNAELVNIFIWFLLIKLIHGMVFEVFYDGIFKKNKKE